MTTRRDSNRFTKFNGQELTFPSGLGSAGQSLTTDGSGVLTYQDTGPTKWVTQASHGFPVLTGLRYNGSSWVTAQADAETTLADGVVVAVLDTNNFIIAESGYFNIPTHGKTPVGDWFFLSAASAGVLTATAPDEFVQPLIRVLDADTVRVYSSSGFLAATGSTAETGIFWEEVSGTSQATLMGQGYVPNNAGLVTLTLPATAIRGKELSVCGKGAGGWLLAQNSSQVIHFGVTSTTTGVTGSLASTQRYDTVRILCVTTNTTFVVLNSLGNLTVT